MAEQYRSAFTKNELVSADKLLVIGVYNKVGEYIVVAGETITTGYGSQSGQDNAVGRLFMALYDTTATPVEIKGKVRISAWSPQNRVLAVLYEFRTEALNTSASNRTLQIPFPESMIGLSEDKKLVLEILPDVAATLSKANTTIVMDITQGVQ